MKKSENQLKFEGRWHIYEMEMWDEDYFNMEVQAYLEIDVKDMGDFQFGLVSGSIDGEIAGDRLEFTWSGSDENDEASGRGWVKLKGENKMIGRIKLNQGDSCKFLARRATK